MRVRWSQHESRLDSQCGDLGPRLFGPTDGTENGATTQRKATNVRTLPCEPARSPKPFARTALAVQVRADPLECRRMYQATRAGLTLKKKRGGDLSYELCVLCQVLKPRCGVPASGGDKLA